MAALLYGAKYHIQNGFRAWEGGYLDVCGAGCQGNVYCVSTSHSSDRDHGSGTWVIESATGKEFDDPVSANDSIYLRNVYPSGSEGTYLDVCGGGCEGNQLCVSTSRSKTRDGGSGTWIIMPEKPGTSGHVLANRPVHLINGYNNYNGGFLDVRGSGCQGNFLCVSTSATFNRDGDSTHWRFVPLT